LVFAERKRLLQEVGKMFKVFFDDKICGAGAGGWVDPPIIRTDRLSVIREREFNPILVPIKPIVIGIAE